MSVIIGRNTTFPSKKSQIISTHADNQSSLIIKVYKGDNIMTKDNHFLGEYLLEGILPAPRGVPRIELTLEINADGILNVSIASKDTG